MGKQCGRLTERAPARRASRAPHARARCATSSDRPRDATRAVVASATRDVAEARPSSGRRATAKSVANSTTNATTTLDDDDDLGDDARDAYVIPPAMCRPLVYTSWFPLAPACVAMARSARDARARGLAALSAALVASSLGHWRGPRWDGPRRYFDLCVVWASVGYGCWLATTMDWAHARGWWCGMPIAFAAYAANETAFRRELRAWRRDGATRERKRFVYRRTTWTHLVGVHAGSSVAASWLAHGIAASRDRD